MVERGAIRPQGRRAPPLGVGPLRPDAVKRRTRCTSRRCASRVSSEPENRPQPPVAFVLPRVQAAPGVQVPPRPCPSALPRKVEPVRPPTPLLRHRLPHGGTADPGETGPPGMRPPSCRGPGSSRVGGPLPVLSGVLGRLRTGREATVVRPAGNALYQLLQVVRCRRSRRGPSRPLVRDGMRYSLALRGCILPSPAGGRSAR